MGADQREPQGPGKVLCYRADLSLVIFPESPGGYGDIATRFQDQESMTT